MGKVSSSQLHRKKAKHVDELMKLVNVFGFLVLAIFFSCKNGPKKLEVIWENGKAIAISIPRGNLIVDSLRVVNSKQIFGSFTDKGDAFEFRPVIPLTAGLNYEIWNGMQLIGKLVVPFPDAKQAPLLTRIYPETDTVPENLLKFYFLFSKPMRTGKSLEHIYLLDKNGDTMRNVFLNLQPELWDTSGKVLTVWLDPGRIKHGLVLNKKLGNPLTQNAHYQLIVSSEWKDTRGLSLTKIYTKAFVVGAADHDVPDVHKWTLSLPKSGTKQPLIINTKEPLDHLLLAESLSVFDAIHGEVKGTVGVRKGKVWEFVPVKPWAAGEYQLHVNARLEDLAANNLNRVFDRDIRKEKGGDDGVVQRDFKIF
jgi:hypothetical protein